MLTDFQSRFQPCIRVQFNWQRFAAEAWPVQINVLPIDQLHRVYTPWYDRGGVIGANYSDEGAHPLSVMEAAKRRGEFDAEKRAFIDAKLSEARRGAIDLDVPALALPGAKFLLLDGNHRLTGLAASLAPLPATLHTVLAPIDIDVLPDLFHWRGVY